ncbi:MAG: membrane protein insertase YidC [Spirochaetaceae bacterium]|nr:membrane protein insertase YidC [Spirochaetaceae bacterium]
MDKRTLLAVILSVIVMTGGYLIQNKLSPPVPVVESELEITIDNEAFEEEDNITETAVLKDIIAVDENIPARKIKVETEKFSITFNTTGAVISSLILKDYEDYNTDKSIEMVNSIDESYSAFNISFDDKYNEILSDNFHYENRGNNEYEFYRDFQKKNADGSLGDAFRIVKKYTFIENEFLFKIDISLINSPYRSYSLSFGPDIGPTYTKLDNRNEYRKYYSFDEGKRTNHKLKNNSETITNQIDWASINGKYFSLIVIPENRINSVIWNKNTVPSYENSSEMFISSSITSNTTNDSFYIYAGPKSVEFMNMYDSADNNAFNLSEINLSEVIDSASVPGLGWLSNILKYILLFINKLIPNFGIAIILLTILIKVILYPITHKGMESTGKMQLIQPKLKKLQDQYKNDPQKLNAATAELYKAEGVNPLGGCLPMLMQMPIFFALYGLLNSYFGLRGAVFIPGWIDNLSAPEYIFLLPFSIPILGWTAIRLLPFLYVGTQLVTTKITQAGQTGTQSNSQMKMLTLGMPIMFFFILYNMPSGLLLYWTMTNLLTAVQQYFINKKKKASAA